MLSTLLLSAPLLAHPNGPTYRGLDRQLQVPPPRIEATTVVDGLLDEPVWEQAAILTGFSQYQPVDGRPAEYDTEIRVWYSATAIHFGVRATAPAGTVRATMADRDRIFSDDVVVFYLGTFNDGRQATVFAVNPLGRQADGILAEGIRGNSAGAPADLSPDFVFESRGRLTDQGYDVEVRIPFKSLQYPDAEMQTWAVHVTRSIRQLGHETSWVPARANASSFMAQAGTLTGLRELRRGLVLDVMPIVTSKRAGGFTPEGAYDRSGGGPVFGGNFRWGITPRLTLNGTVNPDFAEVESDASQFVYDPRASLFFGEKRPFFLDGIEQFSAPNQLIYTRRILDPDAAVKLGGRVGNVAVGYIGAVDSRGVSRHAEDPKNPVFNLLRVSGNLTRTVRLGMAWTDRIEGADYNRVGTVDGRIASGPNAASFQIGRSWTRVRGDDVDGPLVRFAAAHTGRRLTSVLNFNGVSEDFRTESGYVSRGGIVNARLNGGLSFYGRPGALLERFYTEVMLDGTWPYRDFWDGKPSQDRKLHFNQNLRLRGGWNVRAQFIVESFGYDPRLYRGHAIEMPRTGGGLDTVPYNVVVPSLSPRFPNVDYAIDVQTPWWRGLSASAFVLWGKDENFFEWSRANIVYATLSAGWRPTPDVRVDGTYQLQSFRRLSDNSLVGRARIPRVKLEYQIHRNVFLRAVGEYVADERDALRNEGRGNEPVLLRDPATGIYSRALALAQRSNTFRADWLIAVTPSPGTVFYAGYGTVGSEPEALRFGRFERQQDVLFFKASYVFRPTG